MPMDIRDVHTIKHGRVLMMCDHYGDAPEQNRAALGLYYADTRFLSRYEIRLNDTRPLFLHARAHRNYSQVTEATLPIVSRSDNGVQINKNIVVLRKKWIERGVREMIRVQNFGAERRRISLTIRFEADFLDIFEVRGFSRPKRGRLREPAISAGEVRLGYDGLDSRTREISISFEPQPTTLTVDQATFEFELSSQEATSVQVRLEPRVDGSPPPATSFSGLEREYREWRLSCTRFVCSHQSLQKHVDRGILDLRMLQGDVDGDPALEAGVPWYGALFGRDSLITAYQALGVNLGLARGTLRSLAARQGRRVDPWREEEPGKILHELRTGEMAAAGEVPHTPYFGSVDATPLWLIIFGRVWDWTGDREFVGELWPNALRALEWIDASGDLDGDGYVEYQKLSQEGLDNQGWKDSRDGIVHADGSIAEGPIALVEVQGYVYQAKLELARVARGLGEVDLADRLEREAGNLKERFNRDFWMPEQGFYALALDGNKNQVQSITSNPGHCLWSGIVDEPNAPVVVRRLLSDDMSSGWGIRTLSSRHPAFDPVGYHTGSIWPHDCSIIAHGMKLLGFDREAVRVLDQLGQAATHLTDGRLPELFCGFSRADVPVPVEYPVACRPQAWAAASSLLAVRTFGGIVADASRHSLHITRPTLPAWLQSLDVLGMSVGDARVDLSFHRHEGRTSCRVLSKTGDLNVLVRY